LKEGVTKPNIYGAAHFFMSDFFAASASAFKNEGSPAEIRLDFG
jgi:hypothetical protein